MSASQTRLAWPLQKPQQLVYIELGADNGGMMLGICEQGLSFRAVSPLRAEGPIQFTLALDGKTRLQGVGEIVWSEEGGKTGGLKFTNISPQFCDSLREWLSSEATPKNVGREVIPGAALSLDAISKHKPDIRSVAFEEPTPDVPRRSAEAKPFDSRSVDQVQPKQAALEVKAQPLEPARPSKIEQEKVEAKSLEARPVDQIQPKQAALELKAQPLEPTPPSKIEQEKIEAKSLEASSVDQIQPKQAALVVEAQPLEPAPPSKIEQESIEAKPEPVVSVAKPEPVVSVEPEQNAPITPEPELRTVAPLPSERPQIEPIFSLPNFRLPSGSVTPIHIEQTAPTPEKVSPVVPPPAVPTPPKFSLPEPSATQSKAVLFEIEAPASPHEIPLPDFLADDLVQESPRLNRAFATGIIGLALAIILAALLLSFRSDVGAALIYVGEKLAGKEYKPAVTRQPVFNIAPPQTSQSNAAPAEKSTDKPAPAPVVPAVSQPQSSAISTQPSNANSTKGNALPSSPVSPGGTQRVQDLPPSTDGGTGQKEFEQARTILKGNHRQRNLSSAIDLLWISVGKGHVPAEVTLADLYARGDGVEKSCVQARTLLEAAVRKGSPEGRSRLDQLKRRGCR